MAPPTACAPTMIVRGSPSCVAASNWNAPKVMFETVFDPAIAAPSAPMSEANAGYAAPSRPAVVCAAGQVIEGTVYPARFARCIAVGGYDKAGGMVTHYPRGGYADSQRVDIWAQAENINRPSGWLNASGQMQFGFAADDGLPEPSGTSYACPQVAAAAAMWVATHKNRLDEAFADAPWKVTEAFRRALRRSSERLMAQDAAGFGTAGEIAALDIEALLGCPPEADHPYRKRGSAASAGVW